MRHENGYERERERERGREGERKSEKENAFIYFSSVFDSLHILHIMRNHERRNRTTSQASGFVFTMRHRRESRQLGLMCKEKTCILVYKLK